MWYCSSTSWRSMPRALPTLMLIWPQIRTYRHIRVNIWHTYRQYSARSVPYWCMIPLPRSRLSRWKVSITRMCDTSCEMIWPSAIWSAPRSILNPKGRSTQRKQVTLRITMSFCSMRSLLYSRGILSWFSKRCGQDLPDWSRKLAKAYREYWRTYKSISRTRDTNHKIRTLRLILMTWALTTSMIRPMIPIMR